MTHISEMLTQCVRNKRKFATSVACRSVTAPTLRSAGWAALFRRAYRVVFLFIYKVKGHLKVHTPTQLKQNILHVIFYVCK